MKTYTVIWSTWIGKECNEIKAEEFTNKKIARKTMQRNSGYYPIEWCDDTMTISLVDDNGTEIFSKYYRGKK